MIKVKDYLINTTKKDAKIISPDSSKIFEYNDISYIDKITSHLFEDELKKELKKNNDKLLRGPVFILEKSGKKELGNMYRVLTNETTSKSEKYLDEFDKYIDERISRVEAQANDSKVKVELARTDMFEEYINEMLDDVIRGFISGSIPVYEMISVRSLMPNDIATHIVKVKNDYESFSVSEKEKELRHISRSLTGYKALRNFLMEYIKYKNGEYGGLNRTLYNYSNITSGGKYYPSKQIMDQLNNDIKERKLK